MEKLDFEYFELFCTNVFGLKEEYTLQEYTFAYLLRNHESYYSTITNFENFAKVFFCWQNTFNPEQLFFFEEGESLSLNHSHKNDFTWESFVSVANNNSRRYFLIHPEFPETKDEYEKRLMKEDFLSKSHDMDTTFKNKDADVR